MKRLTDLTRTALLGIDRSPLPDFGPAQHARDPELDRLLTRLADQSPEAAVLNQAGILGLYARIGAAPPSPEPEKRGATGLV